MSSPIILKYTTTATNTQIGINLAGTGIGTISWGDASSSSITLTTLTQYTHTYAAIGSYDVSINTTGTITQFGAVTGKTFLKSVTSFGTVGLTSLTSAFNGVTSFTNVGCMPTTIPGTVKDLSTMFTSSNINDPSINSWDVSGVTTMASMFQGATTFNQNIGGWSTSNVKDFSSMFNSANSFNQYIGGWNFSAATTIASMFWPTSAFNNGDPAGTSTKPLVFNCPNATNTSHIFHSAAVFNQSISGSNFSSTTDCTAIFTQATAYNNGGVPLSLILNTTSGANISMIQGFYQAVNFNQDISWNTTRVANMTQLFLGATKFNKSINSWNFNSVTTMASMFISATAFNNGGVALTNQTLNTVGTISMAAIFQGVTALNQDISWNTIKVTDMSYMFAGATSFNRYVGDWNTSSVTSMASMFQGATAFNQNIGGWSTSNVKDFSSMFNGANSFNQYIGGWNFSAATTIASMFWPTSAFNNGDPAGTSTKPLVFNCPNATNTSQVFHSAPVFNQSISGSNFSSTTDCTGFFTQATAYNNGGVPLSLILNTTPGANISMIQGFYQAVNFNQDISWNTTRVANMTQLFQGATKFNQSINSWKFNSVTTMASMFIGATAFNNGGVALTNQTLNTVGTITMSSMFQSATALNQDISWNTIKVTNMNYMFASATSFNKNISYWNFSSVNDISRMFQSATAFNNGGSALTFNTTTSLTNVSYLFYLATSFNQDISMNVSNVSTFLGMFQGATAFNKNMDNWSLGTSFNGAISLQDMFNTATLFNNGYTLGTIAPMNWNLNTTTGNQHYINMTTMFNGANSFSQDISGWNVTNISTMNTMFTANNSNSMSSMTSGLFNNMLKKWSTITPVPTSIALSSIKYTSDGSAALTTLRAAPYSWTITANLVTFTPPTVPYNCNFKLNYRIASINPINASVYKLTAASNPSLILSTYTASSSDTSYNFTGVKVTDSSYSTLTIKDTTTINAIVDIIEVPVFPDPAILMFDVSGTRIIGITLYGTSSTTGTIFWGDPSGNYSVVTLLGPSSGVTTTYTYPAVGLYSVNIVGTSITQYTVGTGITYLRKVTSFGTVGLTSLSGAFNGATGLTNIGCMPTILPGTVKDLSSMFTSSNINDPSINFWDVSGVTSMASMFQSATTFNQNISSWNVSKVINFNGMFNGAKLFNNGYSLGTIGSLPWSLYTVTGGVKTIDMTNMFNGANSFSQDISSWNVTDISAMTTMFASNNSTSMTSMTSGLFNNMLYAWSTTNPNPTNITLSTIKYTSDYASYLTTLTSAPYSWSVNANLVTYGPTIVPYNINFNLNYQIANASSIANNVYKLTAQSNPSVTLSTYTASGTGDTSYNFTNIKLTDSSFSTLTITDVSLSTIIDTIQVSVFSTPAILNYTVSGTQIISINLYGTASSSASVFWGDNTYTATTLSGPSTPATVTRTYAANGSYTVYIIGSTISQYILTTGVNYLTSVTSFGTVGLTSLSGAFAGATGLINNGSAMPTTLPSTVTNLNGMFSGSNLNDISITGWNTINVTDMGNMFSNASSFNQNLNNWIVSSVINFSNMFLGAQVFNNGYSLGTIGTLPWTLNTTSGTRITMENMFYGATRFSQDISMWNVENVFNMNNMFALANDISMNSMTSGIFNNMLYAWSTQTADPSGNILTNIMYTQAYQSYVDTLNGPPYNWGMSAELVTYSPTSVNYGEIFTLNYNIANTKPIADHVYKLTDKSNPSVTVSTYIANSSGTDTSFNFTNVVLRDYDYSTLTITDTSINAIVDVIQINTVFPCLKEGTKILTDKGYIPIEDLRQCDLVKTSLDGYKAICIIGKKRIYNHALQNREKNQLYKCTHEKFPEIFEDVILTGCHSILVDDFVSPEQRKQTIQVNGDIYITDDKYRLPACVDERSVIYEKEGPFTIYHIALENSNYYYNYGIYANGLLVETSSLRYLLELSHMVFVD